MSRPTTFFGLRRLTNGEVIEPNTLSSQGKVGGIIHELSFGMVIISKVEFAWEGGNYLTYSVRNESRESVSDGLGLAILVV